MQKKSRTPKKTAKSATTRHLIKSKTANPTQTTINQLWQKIQQQKQGVIHWLDRFVRLRFIFDSLVP